MRISANTWKMLLSVDFIEQAAHTPEGLLSRMTGGVHLHTLRCPDEASFHRMEAALEKAGILYKKE